MREMNYDTWVGRDGLGRKLLVDLGGKDGSKKVGMFYFLWHDCDKGEIYDHTETFLKHGEEALWDEMAQGEMGYSHYWAQPYFGYYRSDDKWVIRKHCQMLNEAGVDFIFFDNSNGLLYPEMYTAVCETFMKVRAEGGTSPQIVFFNGDRPEFGKKNLEYLWENFYSKDAFRDLWFLWEGKPLLLGNFSLVADENILNFFTIRTSWAFNGWTGDGKGKWPWIADYPQAPGKSPEGDLEQVVVASGFHATLSIGRSYHAGHQPTLGKDFDFGMPETPYGLCYEEQWKTAHEVRPPVVMITGWNEWWAGRWENSGEYVASTYYASQTPREDGKKTFKHLYVDNFNTEYSRDLEPMRRGLNEGGFGDSYFYQTVNEIRKFKGTNPVPRSTGRKTIDLNGPLSQWEGVGPEFLDHLYDTEPRDWPSYGGKLRYVNDTGRNDIDMAKVCCDGEFVYFLVTCREAITPPEGTNWMNLFIDVDGSGWEGYKFLLNRTREGGKASVEVSHTGWDWEVCAWCDFVQKDRALMLRVARKDLGLYADKVAFDFKWADNSVDSGDVLEFMDRGDAAPDGRFNFRYIEK